MTQFLKYLKKLIWCSRRPKMGELTGKNTIHKNVLPLVEEAMAKGIIHRMLKEELFGTLSMPVFRLQRYFLR